MFTTHTMKNNDMGLWGKYSSFSKLITFSRKKKKKTYLTGLIPNLFQFMTVIKHDVKNILAICSFLIMSY